MHVCLFLNAITALLARGLVLRVCFVNFMQGA